MALILQLERMDNIYDFENLHLPFGHQNKFISAVHLLQSHILGLRVLVSMSRFLSLKFGPLKEQLHVCNEIKSQSLLNEPCWIEKGGVKTNKPLLFEASKHAPEGAK